MDIVSLAWAALMVVFAITGWMSNCPGGNDSILYLNRWFTFSK